MYSISKNYGYNLDAFLKAFTKYYGCTPSTLKAHPEYLRPFLPFVVTISISGGEVILPQVKRISPLSLYVYKEYTEYAYSASRIHEITESFKKRVFQNNSIFHKNRDYFVVVINDPTRTDSFILEIGIDEEWYLPDKEILHKTFSNDLWAVFRRPKNVETVRELIEKIFTEWSINQSKYVISQDFLIERHFYDSQNKEDFEILLPIMPALS